MGYREWTDLVGRKHMELTNKEGRRDRVGAPAYIVHYNDGSVEREIFHVNGKVHREDGPAYIGYDDCGKVIYEEFWIYGSFIGYEINGFWSFWEALNEKQKENLNILKTMLRYV